LISHTGGAPGGSAQKKSKAAHRAPPAAAPAHRADPQVQPNRDDAVNDEELLQNLQADMAAEEQDDAEDGGDDDGGGDGDDGGDGEDGGDNGGSNDDGAEPAARKRAAPLTTKQLLIFIRHVTPYYGTQKFKSTEQMCAHVLTEINLDEVLYYPLLLLSAHAINMSNGCCIIEYLISFLSNGTRLVLFIQPQWGAEKLPKAESLKRLVQKLQQVYHAAITDLCADKYVSLQLLAITSSYGFFEFGCTAVDTACILIEFQFFIATFIMNFFMHSDRISIFYCNVHHEFIQDCRSSSLDEACSRQIRQWKRGFARVCGSSR
jgi:hypothetical protein